MFDFFKNKTNTLGLFLVLSMFACAAMWIAGFVMVIINFYNANGWIGLIGGIALAPITFWIGPLMVWYYDGEWLPSLLIFGSIVLAIASHSSVDKLHYKWEKAAREAEDAEEGETKRDD